MIKLASFAILILLLITIIVNIRFVLTELKGFMRKRKALVFGWAVMFVGIGVFSHSAHSVAAITALDVSSKFQLFYMFIGGLVAIALLLGTKSTGRLFQAPIVYLTIYAMFGVLTSIMSPVPMLSAYKATLVLVDTALIASAITYSTRDIQLGVRFLDLTYFLISIFVVGSVVGIILYPNLALLPSNGLINVILAGTIPHMNPNELGFLAAVIAIVALGRVICADRLKHRLLWLSLLLCCLFVVFLAQSRTAVGALCIAIMFMLFAIPKYRVLSFITAILIALALLATAVFTDLSNVGVIEEGATYLQRGQEQGGLRTIIGRSSTWMNIGLPMFYESPIVGHGFDAGVRYGGAEFGIGRTHMHNTYVQILANSGLFGIVPWLLMLISVLLLAKKQLFKYHWPVRTSSDFKHLEIASVLIIVVLRSFTGSVLVNHSWSMMLFLSIVVFLVISRKEQYRRVDHPAA